MSNVRQPLREHWPALLIASTFLLLATIYSVVTPIFESPDELWHYPFVWHLARGGGLPVQDANRPDLWGQEGSQPPLFYALAAALTASIPADDLPSLLYRNPHADIGLVSPDGNANVVVHTEREDWPWRGAVLAVHIVRLFSICLGAGTVLSVYALGRVIWPEQRTLAWLAMAFAAFNPMFLFIASSVNNDNMVTLLATLTLWQLALLLTGDVVSVRRFVGLGVLAGLAALTKVSGLGLVGLIELSIVAWGLRRRDWRTAFVGASLAGGLAAAIAGWWYWRNLNLYGDWLGMQSMVAVMGPRLFTPTAGQMLNEVPGLLRSFWGVFGYFSVPMPAPVYWPLNLMLAAGLAGLALTWLPGAAKGLPPAWRRTWPLLLAWIVLLLVGLLLWTLRTPASQGRLLFPAIGALAALWSVGWLRWVPKPGQALPALGLLALAAWVPWGVIAPAYARPLPLTELPASAQRLDVTFGDGIQLLGYASSAPVVQPGDTLLLTLYWRGERPLLVDYSVFVHVLDEADLIVAQRDVFPGPGVYPTSQWKAGQLFADTYALPVPHTAFAPAQARFEVGLYDAASGARLPTATGDDQVRFGQVEILPRPGELTNPQDMQFEDGIVLAGYALDRRVAALGETVKLTLYWRCRSTPSRDYKVFVHLIDGDGLRRAQHDSTPGQGAAPTSHWAPGQLITDEHPLIIPPDAPAGAYQLMVGLYREDSGHRLRLLFDSGTPMQIDTVALSKIRVP